MRAPARRSRRLRRNGEPDPYHGHKLRYVNPASGDYAMPTIGTFIQLLPKGSATGPYRSTDGTVYVAVEGAGESRVGDQVFALAAARHLRRAELDAASAIMPRARRCCSATPTARCRKSSACGASSAATPERRIVAPHPDPLPQAGRGRR